MSKHSIVHIEFSANNLKTAAKFYRDLFGWKVEEIPGSNYASFAPEDGPGGGFNPVSKDNPAGSTVAYIWSDDIEATLQDINKAGGMTLVPKTEIPGMGWFAIFTDPTGNKVGLFTANMP